MRLCSYVPAVEELARKDDLNLLFSAVTSACPKANIMWRKTAADILLTISRKSLSLPVVSYLHSESKQNPFSLFAQALTFFFLFQTRAALTCACPTFAKGTPSTPSRWWRCSSPSSASSRTPVRRRRR